MHGDILDGLCVHAQEVQSVGCCVQELLWLLNGLIWELVDFDKRHTQIVETGLNVMDSSGVRSRLVCQVGQDEAFVVSHLSSQFILLLVRLERE